MSHPVLVRVSLKVGLKFYYFFFGKAPTQHIAFKDTVQRCCCNFFARVPPMEKKNAPSEILLSQRGITSRDSAGQCGTDCPAPVPHSFLCKTNIAGQRGTVRDSAVPHLSRTAFSAKTNIAGQRGTVRDRLSRTCPAQFLHATRFAGHLTPFGLYNIIIVHGWDGTGLFACLS